MATAEVAVILLALSPLAGAAASLAVGPRRSQGYVVGTAAAVVAAASLALMLDMAGKGFQALSLSAAEELGVLVEAIGVALAQIGRAHV